MNKTKTTSKPLLISSSLIVLAGLSNFIIKLKKALNLTNEYIRSSLRKTNSTTKNALRTSIVVMQNRKWAEDELKKIDATLKKINASEETTKQLQEKKLVLNTPTPDFKTMTNTLHNKQIELTNFIKQINEFENKQNKLNQNFLDECDNFKKEITEIYKKIGLELSEQEFGKNASEIIE
jgi:hypothetical protein